MYEYAINKFPIWIGYGPRDSGIDVTPGGRSTLYGYSVLAYRVDHKVREGVDRRVRAEQAEEKIT